MKKTILTKNIDGFEIIAGFGDLCIEAVETKKAVKPLLEKSDEMKAVRAKGTELGLASKSYHEALVAAREAFKNGNISVHSEHVFTAGKREQEMEAIQNELVDLIHASAEKRIQVWNENLVYHEPRKGEILLEDITLAEKFVDLENNELLTVSGETIIDKRGVKYVKDGKIETISTLGAEPDGPLMTELTAEQFETLRIASLSNPEKTNEIEQIKEGLAGQAANMRAKLEIQGENGASLTKAQDWYNIEVALVEEKYTTNA